MARPESGAPPDPIARPFGNQVQPDPIARPFGAPRPDPIARPYDTGQPRPGSPAAPGGGRIDGRSSYHVAVPRPGPPPPRVDDHKGSRSYGGSHSYGGSYRRPYYSASYYAPYYYPYAFGYGPAGHGYVYFDSYWNSNVWYPQTVVRYDSYASYGYPTGELRLQVRPREAQIFVDGAYAGTVDDFDGTFQSLRLEEGTYRIEIVLPGFEPLGVDVRIQAGQKITYRADLIPEQP
jgi:hypothetical protein